MYFNTQSKLIVLLLIGFISKTEVAAQKLEWSYQNDSARYYFEQGWRYVMDEGNYSKSEMAYRRMYQNDPEFLVGAALLGRISTDLDEQIDLMKKIENGTLPKNDDERKILEVYTELHKLMVMRVKNPENSAFQIKKALDLSLINTGDLARRYSNEPYIISEYIETIHYLFGAEQALDSLEKYDPDENIIFLMGYKALLLAEEGKTKEAIQQTDKLFLFFPGGDIPKPYAVKAQVYDILKEEELSMAFVERALIIDSKNVDMLRLKSKYDGS